jgi:hypothetical protein
MRQYNRIDASEVQGEGAYVVLRPPTWAAAKAFLNNSAGGDDNARGLAMMEALLPLCVAEWNWTDESGAPLALPAVVDALTMNEVMFLVPHVSAFLSPAKN